MRKLNVTLAGKDWMIASMFQRHGGFNVVTTIEEADVICFIGGADVDPEIYGEPRHPATQTHAGSDIRDTYYYEHGLAGGKLMVGICRGAQFLNVKSGGSMYQHVDRHTQGHFLMYVDGQTVAPYKVTSTHHQMMIPRGEFELWGRVRRTTHRDRGKELQQKVNHDHPGTDPDIEIVYYPKTKCLCFQPHPEYGDQPTYDLFFICMNRFLRATHKLVAQRQEPLLLPPPAATIEDVSRSVH